MRASADPPEPATSCLNGSLFVVPPSIVAMLAVGPPGQWRGPSAVGHTHPAGIDSTVVSALHSISDSGFEVWTDA